MEFNTNEAANRIQASDPYVQDAIAAICRRAELVGDGTGVADFCRAQLQAKVDLWQAEAARQAVAPDLLRAEGGGAEAGTTIACCGTGLEKWEEFTCLNSLREVEPSVKLIVATGWTRKTNHKSLKAGRKDRQKNDHHREGRGLPCVDLWLT
jgi:hypothetical protein